MKELILNEENLINKCADNDRHAQEFLYKQFYPELYRIAMRYLSDHHDAEDVVILTFTKIYKNAEKFTYKGQGSLGKWIRTILIHESIRLLKKSSYLHFQAKQHYTGNSIWIWSVAIIDSILQCYFTLSIALC